METILGINNIVFWYLCALVFVFLILLGIGTFQRCPKWFSRETKGQTYCCQYVVPVNWSSIMIFPLLQTADILSDLFLLYTLIWNSPKTQWTWILCIFIILFHSIISSILTYYDMKHQPLWKRYLLSASQFVHIRIFYEAKVAFEEFHTPYELMKLKEWNMLESFPMLVLQIFYILDHHDDNERNIDHHPILFVSVMLSLVSVTVAVWRTDLYGLDWQRQEGQMICFLQAIGLLFMRLSDIWFHVFLFGAMCRFIYSPQVATIYFGVTFAMLFFARLIYVTQTKISESRNSRSKKPKCCDFDLGDFRGHLNLQLVLKTFIETFKNYFTFDLDESKATVWTNCLKFIELWIFLTFILVDDWHVKMSLSDKLVAALKLSLLIAIFILMFGTFLVIYYDIFDIERCLLCRKLDFDALMESGEWDLMYSLIQRDKHKPNSASDVFYQMAKHVKNVQIEMLKKNVRPNVKMILEKYGDINFLINLSRHTKIWPSKETRRVREEDSGVTEMEELVSEMVEYLQNPRDGRSKAVTEWRSADQRRLAKWETKRDKLDRKIKLLKQGPSKHSTLNSFNAMNRSSMRNSRMSVSPDETKSESKNDKHVHFNAEDEDNVLKAFFLDEIVYRLLIAMHYGKDEHKIFMDPENHTSLPVITYKFSVDHLGFKITAKELAFLMRSFGHQRITEHSTKEFFNAILNEIYPQGRDAECSGALHLNRILEPVNTLLRKVSWLRIDPTMGFHRQQTQTQTYHTTLRSPPQLDLVPGPSLSNNIPMTSPRTPATPWIPNFPRQGTIGKVFRRVSSYWYKSDTNYDSDLKQSENFDYDPDLPDVLSNTVDEDAVEITECVDDEKNYPSGDYSEEASRSMTSVDSENDEDTGFVTMAELCYYMVEQPHHQLVHHLQDILLDPIVENSEKYKHFLYKTVGQKLKQFLDEKRREQLTRPRHSTQFSVFGAQNSRTSVIPRDPKKLKADVIDNVSWFYNLSHGQRRKIAEKIEVLGYDELDHIRTGHINYDASPDVNSGMPYGCFRLDGHDYDNYYYIISNIDEGKIFFDGHGDIKLQKFDVFGSKSIGHSGDDPFENMCVIIKLSKMRTGIELLRIKTEDLEKIIHEQLPMWVKNKKPWRLLPELTWIKKMRKELPKQPQELIHTRVIDTCPLFAFLFQCEREILHRLATLWSLSPLEIVTYEKRKRNYVERSVFILQSGLLRITKSDKELTPPKAHEVIGLSWEPEDSEQIVIESVGLDEAVCIVFNRENLNMFQKSMQDHFLSIENDQKMEESSWRTEQHAKGMQNKGFISGQNENDLVQWSVRWNSERTMLVGEANIKKMVHENGSLAKMKAYVTETKYIMGLIAGQKDYFSQYLGNFTHSECFHVMKSCDGSKFETEWKSYSRDVKSNFVPILKDVINVQIKKANDRIKSIVRGSKGGGNRILDDTMKVASSPLTRKQIGQSTGNLVLEYVGDPIIHAVKFYAASMISILGTLHEAYIVHRNVHIGSFWLGPNGYLKLDHFDGARHIGDGKFRDDSEAKFGRKEYHSPDIVNNSDYGLEADWWAFGVTIYEMLHDVVLFSNPHKDLAYGKKHKMLNFQRLIPRISGDHSKDFLQLIFQLWENDDIGDQSHKIAIKLRQHRWFQDFDWYEFDSFAMPAPIKGKSHPAIDQSPERHPNICPVARRVSTVDQELRENQHYLRTGGYFGPQIDLKRTGSHHNANSDQIRLALLSFSPLFYTRADGKAIHNVQRLNFQKEYSCVKGAVSESVFNVYIRKGAFTHEELWDIGAGKIDILHLSGHGLKDGCAIEDGEGGNIFITDQNQKKYEEVFKDIGLVILMMCNSEVQAERIIKMGAKHVIAVDQEEQLHESSCKKFAEKFYRNFLKEENTLWDSFETARRGLKKDKFEKFKLLPEKKLHGEENARYHLKTARELFQIKEIGKHVEYEPEIPNNVPFWMEEFTVDRRNLHTALSQVKSNSFCLVHGPKRQYALRMQFCHVLAYGLTRLAIFPGGIFLIEFTSPAKQKTDIAKIIQDALYKQYRCENEEQVFDALKKNKICLVFTTTSHCESCWFLNKNADVGQVQAMYKFLIGVKKCLLQGGGAMILSLDEISLGLIHRHVNWGEGPSFKDFRTMDNAKKPLTIFPQLLLMRSLNHLVDEVLNDNRQRQPSLLSLLRENGMFARKPPGFPYSLQVAIQIREIHERLMHKKKSKKQIERSVRIIMDTIKAKKPEDLPEEAAKDQWIREGCELLLLLIKQATDLLKYRNKKIYKPLSVVYTNVKRQSQMNREIEDLTAGVQRKREPTKPIRKIIVQHDSISREDSSPI